MVTDSVCLEIGAGGQRWGSSNHDAARSTKVSAMKLVGASAMHGDIWSWMESLWNLNGVVAVLCLVAIAGRVAEIGGGGFGGEESDRRMLSTDKTPGEIAYQWILIVLLICLSALFSGLTLGLMSLDKIGLEIVIGGDPDSQEAKYARAIQPIRNHGNLLLCTLLLGNVSVNAALSILMADYTGGVVGFVVSTGVIVIFGEIFPQAACSRHALKVGANTIWIVRFFLVLLYPIAKPLSWVLDKIFKEEIGAIYSSRELGKLVQIHAKHEKLDAEQAKMMEGALDYKDKLVEQVMTPKSKCFMLHQDQMLDFHTMSKIFEKGYSRIPVYADKERNEIIGMVYAKDLILIDPEDCTSVKSVVQFFGRSAQYMWPDTKLSEALAIFKSGRNHLAIVSKVNNEDETRDPFYEVVGIVTLEDIIEEILQEEILDETDINPEVSNSNSNHPGNAGEMKKVDRTTFDFARLRLLDSHRKNNLSPDEVNAIVAHLSANVDIFANVLKSKRITSDNIRTLVEALSVLELKYGEKLYIKGKPVTHCTLLLSGKMQIVSGHEGFKSTVGPWSLIGQGALDLDQPEGYPSDFSASVVSEDGVRCIRIHRHHFEEIVASKRRMDSLDEVQTLASANSNDNLPQEVNSNGNGKSSQDNKEEEDNNTVTSPNSFLGFH